MNEVKNLYKFQIEDLLECFKFVKNFHLEPTKSSRGKNESGKKNLEVSWMHGFPESWK